MKRVLPICIVSILCALLCLTGCATESEIKKENETTTVAETTVVSKPVLLHNEIENIQNSFSSAILGGIFIEDDNTIIVNLIESEFNSLSISTEERNGIKIIYKPVKFSLAELEKIKHQLEPFMTEYKIASLDANEMTNKIDIQLYEENDAINSLVSEYIDLEYVNINVLPEGYRFEFT